MPSRYCPPSCNVRERAREPALFTHPRFYHSAGYCISLFKTFLQTVIVNLGGNLLNEDLFEVLNETLFYGTVLRKPPLERRIVLGAARFSIFFHFPTRYRGYRIL